MLLIADASRKKFRATLAFARAAGGATYKSFIDNLKYLGAYAGGGACGVIVSLTFDHAPHSFGVIWQRADDGANLLRCPGRYRGAGLKYWFNGGLICHGAGSNGVSMPEASVVLCPKPHVSWQIHT